MERLDLVTPIHSKMDTMTTQPHRQPAKPAGAVGTAAAALGRTRAVGEQGFELAMIGTQELDGVLRRGRADGGGLSVHAGSAAIRIPARPRRPGRHATCPSCPSSHPFMKGLSDGQR